MSGSGREALPDVREWSGGPPRCPVVVESHSWMFAICREALPDVRKWTRGPLGCPVVVGRPSLLSAIGAGVPP